MPPSAFLRLHGHGQVEALREAGGVPGIKDDHGRRRQGLGGADVVGDHEHAVVLLLAGGVFVADEVQAVAQRGDDAHVARGVQGREFLGLDGAVHVVDGRVVERSWGARERVNF